MIEQVITCDICGLQKREANHWFVASQESGELRISSWNSLRLMSSGAKHLCGETCAHKLTSQFLMRLVEAVPERAEERSYTAPAAERTTSARADCDAPSASPWQAPHGAQRSPRSPDNAHLKRPHPCTGTRTSSY